MVDGVVVEEEVDRGRAPPQPNLSVAPDSLDRAIRLLDSRRQRAQYPLAIVDWYEHVHVDVIGAPRIAGAIRQRNRAAEGVGNAPPSKGPVQLDKALGKGHAALRVTSRGYRSSGSWRDGRA